MKLGVVMKRIERRPDTEHARLLANATPEQMAAIMRLLRGQENGVAATAHQESPLFALDADDHAVRSAPVWYPPATGR